MKKLISFLYYWFPTICWMIIIYYLSSKQSVAISSQYWLNFLFFKSLHVLEYSLLYLLFFRSFYSIRSKNFPLKTIFLSTIFLSILYAIFDEIHQTFIPTREGRMRDVIIDSMGIIIMYTVIKKNLNFIKKIFL